MAVGLIIDANDRPLTGQEVDRSDDPDDLLATPIDLASR
jgi:hypothetical protein